MYGNHIYCPYKRGRDPKIALFVNCWAEDGDVAIKCCGVISGGQAPVRRWLPAISLLDLANSLPGSRARSLVDATGADLPRPGILTGAGLPLVVP